MSGYTIVGGGISGLLCATVLKKSGAEIFGFEKEDQIGLGGSLEIHRIFGRDSVDFLNSHALPCEWECVDEEGFERHKGSWRRPEGEYLPEEQFFLRGHFFRPSSSYTEMLEALSEAVGEMFSVRKNVAEVHPETKKLVFQDGSEHTYETLVWCAPVEGLTKAWGGEFSPVLRSLENREEPAGMLNLVQELSAPMAEVKHTMVFPFRYKDARLKALGFSQGTRVQWITFLGEEIADDREEIAKCVRALKRELLKEFVELKDVLTSERIAYEGATPARLKHAAKSLEVLPDVLYVGPQLRLKDAPEELEGLDRTLNNCRNLEKWIESRRETTTNG